MLTRPLDLGLAAIVLVELALLAILLLRGRRAVRSWRATRDHPRLDRLEAAITATGVPPRLGGLVATELGVLGYALGGWRAAPPSPARFTVHRDGGWALTAGVLVFLILVEAAVAHVALATYASTTAAWLVTGASLYGALWLLGDLHALRHGGVTIAPDALELAIGVRWRGRIPWTAVVSVERTDRVSGPGLVDASVVGPSVVLHLRRPCLVRGPFGRRNEATAVALSIDEPERFLADVSERL